VSQASGAPSPDSEERVGAILARMRRAKNLTGGQLGDLVSMSQPKISRLERGIGSADPEDVGRIAEALGADDDQVAHLKELAERAQTRPPDWLPNSSRLASRQRDVARWEADARTFRLFQTAVIAGPLQTSGYARAVLSSLQSLLSPGIDTAANAAVPEAVSARVRRQEVLADQTKTFHFVMAETVLSNRIAAPEEMPAQIGRLRDVAKQGNVTIAMIPADRRWEIPPIHGFLLLDDHTVTVDLFNNGFTSHSPADARFYRDVFDSFQRLATTDIDEMLDRYLALYLDLARPRSGRSEH